MVLIQVAVPSRQNVEEYQDLRTAVCELVGKINGQYGELLRLSPRATTTIEAAILQ